MGLGYQEIIDGLTLAGLLGFPGYSAYWFPYHLRGERRRRLWLGFVAFLIWCAATYFCFLRLMLACMGGNCAGKVSPFLEFAIAYAASTALLIGLMHWYRAR